MALLNWQRDRKAQSHAKNVHGTAMVVIAAPVLTAQSRVIARSGPRVTFSLCQKQKRRLKNPAGPTLPQVLKHRRQHPL